MTRLPIYLPIWLMPNVTLMATSTFYWLIVDHRGMNNATKFKDQTVVRDAHIP
jgi:paraquat-inducible protein B